MRTVWSSFWLADSNSNIWRLQTGDLARAYGRAVSESTNDDLQEHVEPETLVLRRGNRRGGEITSGWSATGKLSIRGSRRLAGLVSGQTPLPDIDFHIGVANRDY